jgi:hypothetical protein
MARSIFASFHYDNDHSRVQQVLNMGAIEGDSVVSPQKWEQIKRSGDSAIERWIDAQMRGKSAVVVLVGYQTASRKWVMYEIRKAWEERRPLVGIRIHGLKNLAQLTSQAGPNPFAKVSLKNGRTLDQYVSLHNPIGVDSKAVYASISKNLDTWIAGAVTRS